MRKHKNLNGHHKHSLRTAKIKIDNLYGNLEKIKSTIADASRDVSGRAGKMLALSFKTAKGQTIAVRRLVVKKPVKTLSLAMLTAFAIGYIVHRHR